MEEEEFCSASDWSRNKNELLLRLDPLLGVADLRDGEGGTRLVLLASVSVK